MEITGLAQILTALKGRVSTITWFIDSQFSGLLYYTFIDYGDKLVQTYKLETSIGPYLCMAPARVFFLVVYAPE